MNTIQPLGDNLLIKVIPNEARTSGGILLPTAAVEESCTGVVLVVNPESYYRDGSRRHQPQCSVGDTVVFAKKSGTKVLHAPAGEDWLTLPEDCIYYRVEQNNG